ncbi:molybdopterin molybdotransferase MoeA [candidate division CSSED10-310 bacterium]|uniref:Molybdopterin molybdenumtransferase n=1 Tax=candidate division CSSED10-310 bacterium TaxID=2855610 RepID=A0ABV6YWM7_UNCC1
MVKKYPATEMISFEEAIHHSDRVTQSLLVASETISVHQAVNRILREDIKSRLDLPPFNKSAMDGYAILENDDRESYQLLEIVAAGSVGSRKLQPGTTVKVMTGAPVPAGTGRVVMVEHTIQSGEMVTITQKSTNTNISLKAEDIQTGDVVLTKGRQLDEVDIATIISCGVSKVHVSRPIKIALFATGDEIVNDFDELEPGKIMNSNGPLMRSLAARYDLDVVMEKIVPDDKVILRRDFREGLAEADIVVLSGGVSVGDFDYVEDIMRELGLIVHFTRVAQKPGKPMTFASSQEKVIFGLPGNPVAVYTTFFLYVLRAAVHLAGGKAPVRYINLPLDHDFRRRKGIRKEFIPTRLTVDGRLAIVPYHGSAHLSALTQADGFLVIPVNTLSLSAGTRVQFIPFKMKGL